MVMTNVSAFIEKKLGLRSILQKAKYQSQMRSIALDSFFFMTNIRSYGKRNCMK